MLRRGNAPRSCRRRNGNSPRSPARRSRTAGTEPGPPRKNRAESPCRGRALAGQAGTARVPPVSVCDEPVTDTGIPKLFRISLESRDSRKTATRVTLSADLPYESGEQADMEAGRPDHEHWPNERCLTDDSLYPDKCGFRCTTASYPSRGVLLTSVPRSRGIRAAVPRSRRSVVMTFMVCGKFFGSG